MRYRNALVIITVGATEAMISMFRINFYTRTVFWVLMLLPSAAKADSSGWLPQFKLSHALLKTSLHTQHFTPEPEHNNHQQLISLEVYNHENWLLGGARFKNSFDQDSVYVYGGKSWPFWQQGPHLEASAKLTAGILHGYRGEYRDKIPFNHYGVAPAALPSLGLRWHWLETDLIVFGTAGVMVTSGIQF